MNLEIKYSVDFQIQICYKFCCIFFVHVFIGDCKFKNLGGLKNSLFFLAILCCPLILKHENTDKNVYNRCTTKPTAYLLDKVTAHLITELIHSFIYISIHPSIHIVAVYLVYTCCCLYSI